MRHQTAALVRTLLFTFLSSVFLIGFAGPTWAQFLIVGNDNKRDGPGKDTIAIFSIANPGAPKLLTELPLENSISGPPTNMAITPDDQIALVANATHATLVQGKVNQAPDDHLYVIDLTASPPKLLTTLTVGKQPSGMAINAAGDLALVTFRADNSLGVFSISGKDVKLIDTVPMGDSVSAVSFTSDGKHALVAKQAANKIAWLNVDGQKLTYTKYDMNVGVWPYNVVASPKGDIALNVNENNNGSADGQADSVSVIDLGQSPVRIIDYVTVGDGPEGLTFAPSGSLAFVAIQNGGSADPSKFFYHPHGLVDILKIDGNQVTNVGSVETGRFPEAIAVSPDGGYVYAGGDAGKDLDVFKIDGASLTEVLRISLGNDHPASMVASPK
jgi:DNA-binding beta-propeller fold protein YncE